jgi:cation/acetate symporter
MNKEGAISGMIAGTLLMLFYMCKYKLGWFDAVIPSKSDWWFGISPEGFGSVAMCVNFIVSLVVSKFTKPTPEHIKLLVEKIRIPSGVDEVNNNH